MVRLWHDGNMKLGSWAVPIELIRVVLRFSDGGYRLSLFPCRSVAVLPLNSWVNITLCRQFVTRLLAFLKSNVGRRMCLLLGASNRMKLLIVGLDIIAFPKSASSGLALAEGSSRRPCNCRLKSGWSVNWCMVRAAG